MQLYLEFLEAVAAISWFDSSTGQTAGTASGSAIFSYDRAAQGRGIGPSHIEHEKAEPRRQGSAISFCADGLNAAGSASRYFDACALRAAISASVRSVIAPILLLR
jgi:hypothetical protein